MALTAPSLPVEEGFSFPGVSNQNIEYLVVRSSSQGIAHLLVQEVREVNNLILRECAGFSLWMAFCKIRSDSAAIAVMKNNQRPHQVCASFAAACFSSMAGDALRNVDGSAARSRIVVNDLFVIGARLVNQASRPHSFGLGGGRAALAWIETCG